jgi:hypothetical protein
MRIPSGCCVDAGASGGAGEATTLLRLLDAAATSANKSLANE